MEPVQPYFLICWFAFYSIWVWFSAPKEMPYRKRLSTFFILTVGILLVLYYVKTANDGLFVALLEALSLQVTLAAAYSTIPLVTNHYYQ